MRGRKFGWVLSFLSVLVWAGPAAADTYTVNSGNDSGPGSLRQAILDANTRLGSDLVVFATSNSIYTDSEIDITDPVMIFGQGNTILSSSNSHLFVLTTGSSGSTLTGLALLKGSTAIQMSSNCNLVTNCRIGTDWADGTGLGNVIGVAMDGSFNCVRNSVISGNLSTGVSIVSDGSVFNRIQGNVIGANAAGTLALGNNYGVYLYSGVGTLIGGDSSAGEGNLISGNTNGVYIYNANPTGTTICGNVIGLSLDQSAGIPNTTYGVWIRQSSGNWVGLPSAHYGNIIAGNTTNDLIIGSGGAPRPRDNIIQNNLVGINESGTTFANNVGINLNAADNNVIGGVRQNLEGNIVSGHASGGNQVGIFVAGNGNTISGNLAGLNVTGTAARPNGGAGIFINGSCNLVGGPNAAGATRGNVTSGNGGSGISVNGMANGLQGNVIGLAQDGATSLGNGGYGVQVNTTAIQTLIGGTDATCGNVVSANGNYGIYINSASGVQVLNNLVGLTASGNASRRNTNAGLAVNQAQGARVSGNRSSETFNLINSSSGNTLTANTIGVYANGSPIAALSVGLQIYSDAHDNWIGLQGGNGNLIANTSNYGINISGAATLGNALLGNTVCAFGAAGIVLDSGGNADHPAPVILEAYAGAPIVGTATPLDTIEVFLAEARNGSGGALRYLGSANADGAGVWSLAGDSFNNGDRLTALATDASRNTSAFASNYTAAPPPTLTSTPTVTATATRTPTATPTPSPTVSPTVTPTPTVSVTATISPVISATATSTATDTATVTVTETRTPAYRLAIDFDGKAVLAYPMPARQKVNFLFDLARASRVEIRIYNLAGELMTVLEGTYDPSSRQPVVWDCQGTAPGIYVARALVEGEQKAVLKLALIK